jgi:hypothetical protein
MDVSNPQSFNRYSYVSGQPTNFVDPAGLLIANCTSTCNRYQNEDGTWSAWECETHCEFINIGNGSSWVPGGVHTGGGGGIGRTPATNAGIGNNSCAFGAGLLEYRYLRNGQWFGNNSFLGLTKGNRLGWGGNGSTGARSLAIGRANAFRVIGRTAFGIGSAITLYQVYYGEIPPGKGAADIVFSAVGTFWGPPGLLVGGVYFIGDATVGWDSVGHALEYRPNERDTSCARRMLTNRLGPPR